MYIIGTQCGVTNTKASKIIRGDDAKPGQFPWQLSIEYQEFRFIPFNHLCGASLIGPNHAITAAHCTDYGTR